MAYTAHQISTVFLVKWSRVERGDGPRIVQQVRDAARQVRKPLAYIALIPAKLELPDELIRRELADAVGPVLDHCSSVRIVIEGDGFRHAALRSVAAGMLLLIGQRGKLSVHETLRGALEASDFPQDLNVVLEKAKELGFSVR